jgi:predicted sulfurtransferase
MNMASKVVLLALLAVGSVFSADGVMAAEAPRMDQDELKAHLDNPKVVVIDVRAYTDWLLSGDKISGAVRENYRDFEGWYAKYPKDKTIVLYCA